MIDTRALLQSALLGVGCQHEWSKDVDPQQRRIVCNKCGLYAYVVHEGGTQKTEEAKDGLESAHKSHGLALIGER